ncbi:MAG: DUF6044 family protein [Candidatus Aquicultorales bacterium]
MALGSLFLYWLPKIVLGVDSHAVIFDNLDSSVPHFKILAESGKALSFGGTIPNVMNGLPRASFPSGLNVTVWLYMLLSPFRSYLVNELIIHLLAFLGMYALLKKHVVHEENANWIAAGVSLAFAMLPFYPAYGLSVAGQPLLLWAFLNIRKTGGKPVDFIVFLLFPLYSSLVLAGVFIIISLTGFVLYDSVKRQRLDWRSLLAIAMMTAGYAIVEFSVIRAFFFDKGFISHREQRNPAFISGSKFEALVKSLELFVKGHVHAQSYHQLILYAAIPLALVTGITKPKARWTRDKNKVILLAATTCLIALFVGAAIWEPLSPLKSSLFLLKAFQFDRFYWFYPLLWYLLLAFALKVVATGRKKRVRFGRYVAAGLLLAQIGFVAYSHPERSEDIRRILKIQDTSPYKAMTWAEFYSEDLFSKIKAFIEKDPSSYRVISVGMHPAIAQYNGFYTLDNYESNYPLEYKMAFRKIIEKELVKSQRLQQYFDQVGNRAYVFSKEAFWTFAYPYDELVNTKYKNARINGLAIDSKALKDLGGDFMLSAIKLPRAEESGLKLQKVFEAKSSPWRIYFYEIDQ